MNFYEHYEPVLGGLGHEKYFGQIFYFLGAEKAFSCSFFYIMFINFAIRKVLSGCTYRLMNFMKFYEHRVFMGFFWKVLVLRRVFMKFVKEQST